MHIYKYIPRFLQQQEPPPKQMCPALLEFFLKYLYNSVTGE
jgi:hypothetical protein